MRWQDLVKEDTPQYQMTTESDMAEDRQYQHA